MEKMSITEIEKELDEANGNFYAALADYKADPNNDTYECVDRATQIRANWQLVLIAAKAELEDIA